MISPPRIIAGTWRGKKLSTPTGFATRPTAARVRQAAFDILLHAPWAGPNFVAQARMLDVFAGTGAFGLEFLSRGGASATFLEHARPALEAIRANIAGCKAETRSLVVQADALDPPPGAPHDLLFLDPPYGQNFVPSALAALRRAGWLREDAIIVAELGPGDKFLSSEVLAERRNGRTVLIFCRAENLFL